MVIWIQQTTENGERYVSTRVITNDSMVKEMFAHNDIYKVKVDLPDSKPAPSKPIEMGLRMTEVGYGKSRTREHLKMQIISFYLQQNKKGNRYVIECEESEINIDGVKGNAINFKVVDSVTGQEVDCPREEFIRSVTQMNAEYTNYNTTLNEFIKES